ncbi:hypothetical protein TGAM01_v201210 [Trichoderma gamsii]|uniref:Nephrocystin 3-like N-terminal domain-containing protein n=1 Tax=Trichoderma gamsii TaxID=398673 RepID=A0A2P4ZZW1_9HYPO|nr:hypothetical protein TGAM01_v201210 [Trichoderma gamsii]PON29844.1 hypothetical protein TGAM01_v201210 [Trichoderma gamsii]
MASSNLATSSSTAPTSKTLAQLSSSQFPLPTLTSPPSSGPPQLPAPSSPPSLEVPKPLFSGQKSTRSLTIWEEVLCKVNKDTEEWIQKHGLSCLASVVEKPEDQIKQLIDLIEKKKKKFEDKDSPMKIKIGNQEIIFRAYIADVIGFLTFAGDVAMNFAPPQASAPWAAAKAALKIPIKQIEQMAALAGIIQLFTRIVRRARLDVTSSPMTQIDEGVAKLLENVNNENNKLEKLMDFISSEQFGKGHVTMKDTRIQGTGDWLIDHESFREWQAIASSSTLLCLKGTVGTGKTYLTSRVIDRMIQTLEASTHDEGFAFFYCNRSGSAMQDPLIVLRSFVRQLSYKANNYDYIQSNVIQRCEKAKQEGRSLSYTDCKDLILKSMNLYSKTTIILDALDESDISY